VYAFCVFSLIIIFRGFFFVLFPGCRWLGRRSTDIGAAAAFGPGASGCSVDAQSIGWRRRWQSTPIIAFLQNM
jgi:hypothetical protein